jgi:surface antigen
VFSCDAAGGKQEGGAVVGAIIGGIVGNQVAKRERGAGTVVGAGIGAAIGSSIGCKMQEEDARRAQAALDEALATGQPTSWRNPNSGAYGDIRVLPASNSGYWYAPNTVNVRATPSTKARVVGQLGAGESFGGMSYVHRLAEGGRRLTCPSRWCARRRVRTAARPSNRPSTPRSTAARPSITAPAASRAGPGTSTGSDSPRLTLGYDDREAAMTIAASPLSAARRRQVAVPGGAIAALEFGPADRPLDVLFLHANGFNAGTYADILAPLGDRLRILAVDQRGHGLTTSAG